MHSSELSKYSHKDIIIIHYAVIYSYVTVSF